MFRPLAPIKGRASDRRAVKLDVYTHVVSADDVRLAEQLDGILRPNAPKLKEERVAPGGQPFVH
jgi:hypothetical protein